MKVGVVLSGGQAPGGHNVIAGLYDYVKKISPQSIMIGFCDGPHGVMLMYLRLTLGVAKEGSLCV